MPTTSDKDDVGGPPEGGQEVDRDLSRCTVHRAVGPGAPVL